MQAQLLVVAGIAGAAAMLSAFAERRRIRRRETHGPGWMPWPTLTLAAAFIGLIALAYGLNS